MRAVFFDLLWIWVSSQYLIKTSSGVDGTVHVQNGVHVGFGG